VLSKGTGFKR